VIGADIDQITDPAQFHKNARQAIGLRQPHALLHFASKLDIIAVTGRLESRRRQEG